MIRRSINQNLWICLVLSMGFAAPLHGQPDQMPGFPIALPAVDSYPITAADMDGDGLDEIIFSHGDGKIHIYKGDGTALPGFPTNGATVGLEKPMVGDVDGDGLPDVLAVSVGFISGYGNDGEILPGLNWRRIVDLSLGTPGAEHPFPHCLADLDGDGDLEIVIARNTRNGPIEGYHTRIFAFQGDGSDVENFPITLEFDPGIAGGLIRRVAIADLDFDGKDDIIAYVIDRISTSNNPRIYVCDGQGNIRAGFPAYAPSNVERMSNFMAVDLGNDRNIEFVGLSGPTSIINQNGSLYTPQGIPGFAAYSCMPATADLDGDGLVEMVVGTLNRVAAYNQSGELIQQTVGLGNQILAVATGDVDGDGKDEVVALGALNQPVQWVYLLDDDLSIMPGYPIDIGPRYSIEPYESILLTNLDGDNDLEIVATTINGLLAFDLPNPGPLPATVQWGQRNHDSTNSSYDLQGRIEYFLRGDIDGDARILLNDAIRLLSILFENTPSDCPLACDVDGDNIINLTDVISLLSYQFVGGPPPAEPFPECYGLIIEGRATCSISRCP